MDLDTRLLVDLLLDHKRADRALGQHFLHDESVLTAAITACTDAGAPLDESSHVLEVGPGAGSLTLALLGTGARITAMEVDAIAIEHLERTFAEPIDDDRLRLVQTDALHSIWPDVTHIVANIPYQISSPLLERIQRLPVQPRVVVLLLQEEFAHRLAMQAGATDRGPLGLSIWLQHDVTLVLRVPPHCFVPAPRVHSRLVSLKPASRAIAADERFDARLFRMLVAHAFERRRQKLRSRLRRPPKRLGRLAGWHKQRWQEAVASIDSDASAAASFGLPAGLLDDRPESLEPEDWVRLTIALAAQQTSAA